MQTWRIGAVRIRSLIEHAMPVPPEYFLRDVDRDQVLARRDALAPYIDEHGHLLFTFQAFLVESQGQRIIVDTCFGNGRQLPYLDPLHTDFLERLVDAGFGPDDVDVVLCTHLHHDHVGWTTHLVDGDWVPTFPRSRYLFGRLEHEHWQHHEHSSIDLADTIDPVVAAGLHELVEVDHALTDEVRLEPTPGHTPGHVSVRIRSDGSEAFITGDLVHHPLQIVEPSWSSQPDDDVVLASATRRRVFADLAGSDVLVLGTHFAAPASGRVEHDGGDHLRWVPVPSAG